MMLLIVFSTNDVSSLNKYFLEIDDLVIGMDGSKVGKKLSPNYSK